MYKNKYIFRNIFVMIKFKTLVTGRNYIITILTSSIASNKYLYTSFYPNLEAVNINYK